MEVILLERVENLGNFGDLVKVKNGFARNFLIPQGKALLANENNKASFEARKADIEKQNADKKKEAEKFSGSVADKFYVITRQAGDDGRLFGSVTIRDIADAVNAEVKKAGEVKKTQIALASPIKYIGVHKVKVFLHPELAVNVLVNVARSAAEAENAKKEFLNPKPVEVKAEEVTVEDEEKAEKKAKKSSKKAESEEEAAE